MGCVELDICEISGDVEYVVGYPDLKLCGNSFLDMEVNNRYIGNFTHGDSFTKKVWAKKESIISEECSMSNPLKGSETTKGERGSNRERGE
jgi:hypothetical protein